MMQSSTIWLSSTLCPRCIRCIRSRLEIISIASLISAFLLLVEGPCSSLSCLIFFCFQFRPNEFWTRYLVFYEDEEVIRTEKRVKLNYARISRRRECGGQRTTKRWPQKPCYSRLFLKTSKRPQHVSRACADPLSLLPITTFRVITPW